MGWAWGREFKGIPTTHISTSVFYFCLLFFWTSGLSWGMQDLPLQHAGLSSCGTHVLERGVVVCGLSCPGTCGILWTSQVPQW